ncbi:hypothetical protein [Microbacterium sp. A93]|uniref:hypothetical protein n=1 Tax=unclassified Microbacterium TaxID=2609290 RepID=UPI003F442021
MAESDELMLAQLRAAFEELDPAPSDLADRMIAAIAISDLSREYALLTLIENAEAAVRGDSKTTTLQFSDGTSSILLHISHTANRRRRIDGWVDAGATEVRLTQGERDWSITPDEQGRFAFDDVLPGLSRVLLVTGEGHKDLLTPQFEA